MSMAKAFRDVQRGLVPQRPQRKRISLIVRRRRGRRHNTIDNQARRPQHLPRGIHPKRTHPTKPVSTLFRTPVGSPVIVSVTETLTNHSFGCVPASASNLLTPDSHSYSSARQSVQFTFNHEAVQKKELAYWPAWYHQQRQWELQQAKLNSTLDETYRLDLVERRWDLVELMILGELLMKLVLGVARENERRRQLRLQEEMKMELELEGEAGFDSNED
ncbi:hypothetical protein QBC32DRAFT_366087 [Pseudoneurospora amorphoporcata]|uniref:Uncharacterized protein n=1 Tax=Pseudoneurospora amorphoporcata TaxID=241081 RepID=A0AAN6NK19_9PEZI|nr:hypothetical protein QBC32DRAFT_366087 [Pseudoneurospora amorphoporcata]